ncbi:MAG: hypothetical protein F4Y49_10715 [Dehalococcoidia bacterium]|nr:hypothetical protein [Dehalococcoidia bacterium]
MKTTLTLDDDVADYLNEQCRLQDKPFERVVNEMLRRGMKMSAPLESTVDNEKESKPPPFKVTPNHSGFASGVDPLSPKDILEEMYLEDYFRKEHNFRKDLDDRT